MYQSILLTFNAQKIKLYKVLSKYIIFFDGECPLCQCFIRFVLKKDTKKRFLYTPLQGETAHRYLSQEDIKDLKSIVVIKNDTVFKKAAAICVIFKHIYLRFSWLLQLFPLRIFNFLYRVIAENRYRILKKESKISPLSKEQKQYFLP